ncbi:hypothetical protein CVT25_011410 [Psilocybe cyanescens]|uniref:TPX2 C-terminal domain-containing protein n=1 Tax=Psilocybe cyanescens TaxID=93625 RepID=A0A409WGI0_PSICY|nr:hypothetical protein CVT25_011410 [Psilocybe cyanescens]
MPQHYSGDQLSMRHLPDISDTSFSFQIPGSAPYDNLLAEDDKDFFRGVDVSEISPNLPLTHSANEPLTISQLTPRPTIEKRALHNQKRLPPSSPTSSYPQQNVDYPIPDTKSQKPITRAQHPEGGKLTRRKSVAQPRPRLVTPSMNLPHLSSVERSPVGARFEAMKAEVDLLAEHLPVPPSSADKKLDNAGAPMPNGTRTYLEKKKAYLYEEEETREKHLRTKHHLYEDEIIKRKIINKATEKNIRVPAVNSSMNMNTVFSPPEPSSLSKDPNGEDQSMADTTISSTSPDGGVAARLVQYSQKLINSFSQFNSDGITNVNVHHGKQASLPWDAEAGTNENESFAHPQNNNISDQPLTLSQLSPRKRSVRPPTPTPPVSVPTSPLRSSSKRPAPSEESEIQRKKSKTDASAAGGEPSASQSSEMKTNAKLDHAPTQRHSISAVSGRSRRKSATKIDRGISKSKAINEKLNTRRAPAFKPRSTETLTGDGVCHALQSKPIISTSTSTSSSSTSMLQISRQRTSNHTIEPVNSLSLKGKRKMSSSSGNRLTTKPVCLIFFSFSCHFFLCLQAERQGEHEFYIPNIPLHTTKPVEFHLSTDARARSMTRRDLGDKGASSSQSQSQSSSRSHSRSQRERSERKQHAPIPDFKALHAAQEAKLALRKENIHPTVPLPIKWETDHRAKERQKFDEMVREKEREQERLVEERRREREEQEERELRELRKKAVPKAHEVPEWYKEAPKKKDKTIGPIGR